MEYTSILLKFSLQLNKLTCHLEQHILEVCAIQYNVHGFQQTFTVAILKSSKMQGCHGQGKVREKQKFFKVREKSGNFAKSQGKSQFLSKSVKSQGILYSGWRKVL